MPSESPTSASRTSSSERVSGCPPRAAKYSRFSTPERCPYSGTLLRQIADTPLRQDGLSDDVEALDARATCGRPQQPEEQGERRGLPRSVRAQEAIDLARADRQLDVCQGDDVTVLLGQPNGLDDRRRRLRSTRQEGLFSVADHRHDRLQSRRDSRWRSRLSTRRSSGSCCRRCTRCRSRAPP
jgi:hypothetical protein